MADRTKYCWHEMPQHEQQKERRQRNDERGDEDWTELLRIAEEEERGDHRQGDDGDGDQELGDRPERPLDHRFRLDLVGAGLIGFH